MSALSTQPSSSLTRLPPELLLTILTRLDIPDLLSVSRTSHTLRHLTHDPLLHLQRLARYRVYLSLYYPLRPPLSSLRPPSRTIYLSNAHNMARNLSRQLIAIRLNRNLKRRPSAGDLVATNVLPEEVYVYEFEYGCGGCKNHRKGKGIAPSLLGVKRSIERERVKAILRGWLEGRQYKEEGERRKGREEKRSVRELVRRFRAWAVDDDDAASGEKMLGRSTKVRWGVKRQKREDPTRAHVLGLRRFWEGLASAGAQAVRV